MTPTKPQDTLVAQVSLTPAEEAMERRFALLAARLERRLETRLEALRQKIDEALIELELNDDEEEEADD